jgi:hypothetical protein
VYLPRPDRRIWESSKQFGLGDAPSGYRAHQLKQIVEKLAAIRAQVAG